jgi:hypothetical protein
MKLNNLYNFKNPVKHFLDIDSIKLPEDISTFELDKLCWVEPFNFRVNKNEDNYRTLKMPNILNFVAACEQFKGLPHFKNIQLLDPLHKRLSANVSTGDFVIGEYDRQLEKDFEQLCIYDVLLRVDIKEYYGRVYTHFIDFHGKNERYLSNMNAGKTNGLIMGNYLSLYFAETNLMEISKQIQIEFTRSRINCEFSYFSDDFYFFCNKGDTEKVIKIFDKVLEKYELERNDSKKEIWTYEDFNNYNLVARYWKKVIAHCNNKFYADREDNKLYIINQIVYRLSNLDEDGKLKKVFINNLFKTKYFRELDLEKFKVKKYDYHQLCFILKYSPEAMLYVVDKFNAMSSFENQKLFKFFQVRYREVLQTQFNEEQLYFYYAIKIFGFTDILDDTQDLVLESNNQLLISYYLKDAIFGSEYIEKLKEFDSEQYWFQNYHLILYTADLKADLENSIEKYLIPKKVYLIPKIANREIKKRAYMEFYKENINFNNPIIRDIVDVNTEIREYLALRIEESEAEFVDEEVDDDEVGDVDVDVEIEDEETENEEDENEEDETGYAD